MNKYFKILYIIICVALIPISVISSLNIIDKIKIQKLSLNENKKELNYLMELNKKIVSSNSALQEIIIKKTQIINLNDEQKSLITQKKILEESISKYNYLNEELKKEISYYE